MHALLPVLANVSQEWDSFINLNQLSGVMWTSLVTRVNYKYLGISDPLLS